MNRKWQLFAVISLLISFIMLGTVYSAGHIKLLINYEELKPKAPLQINSGIITGPIMQIAEALGAAAEWDKKNQKVSIIDSRGFQINQLESALVPTSSLTAATLWAKAAVTRNGALRYAISSSDLKKKLYFKYKAMNWVIGVSSPWVKSYKIIQKKENISKSLDYEIDYTLTDSTGMKYPAQEIITVKRFDDKWFIMSSNDPSYSIPQPIIIK
jgi:hypothetical protein